MTSRNRPKLTESKILSFLELKYNSKFEYNNFKLKIWIVYVLDEILYFLADELVGKSTINDVTKHTQTKPVDKISERCST